MKDGRTFHLVVYDPKKKGEGVELFYPDRKIRNIRMTEFEDMGLVCTAWANEEVNERIHTDR